LNEIAPPRQLRRSVASFDLQMKELIMEKRIISLTLSILLAHLIYLPTLAANPKSSKEERQVEKLKAGILRLGTGPEARIKVKLRDNTELSGYISEVREDSFVVVDAKTGQPTSVAYPQVAQAKGNNLSKGQKIGLAIAIGVFAVLFVVIVKTVRP
jgi:hypothetical protein